LSKRACVLPSSHRGFFHQGVGTSMAGGAKQASAVISNVCASE
jgi:hypothetical protein